MPKTVKNAQGPGRLALQILRARAAEHKRAWLLRGGADESEYEIYTAYESAAGLVAATLDRDVDAILEYDCIEELMPALPEHPESWVAWNNAEARHLYKKPVV